VRIGIDAGGTFTDFVVVHDDGRVEYFKLRSNPRSPASVILNGISRVAGRDAVEVVHGSTVATNALLERKGARTAFVTTAGFEDIVFIGRQNRRELYNLTPSLPRHLLADQDCFGVRERTLFDGSIETPVSARDLAALRRKLEGSGAGAVAICLLHSYQNPAHERAVLRAMRGLGYVCASHEVSPEFREYERASTTVINAYVGPLMDAYLAVLEKRRGSRFWIVQSNGGFLTPAQARRHAVRTILSGPAGGVVGAVEMGRRSGFRKVIGFDMGGTSTDVCLADGAARETTEAYIDGMPVRVPMLDIHTVGAGGGSLARIDSGGLLRVGPESAGADPGPACYGVGEEPAVTDAQVVLGRIRAEQFLGGQMAIYPERAEAAVGQLANALGLSLLETAEGIVRVVNANMERAIRVVSVERGFDPREFALVAFGGGGGLHACQIASELGIRTVVVPRLAEALSALGMLQSDHVRDYAAGVLGRHDLAPRFTALDKQARREMPGAELVRTADLRYAGQSYELNVPWEPGDPAAPFHHEHQHVYGYANPGRAVEVVTIRLRARIAAPKPELPPLARRRPAGSATRRLYLEGTWREVPVLNREEVSSRRRPGPALVLDYGTTTLVPEGWTYRVDGVGNLVVSGAGPRSARRTLGPP
jgi:N-methylhydantoinase A